jgi:recombination protein RecR
VPTRGPLDVLVELLIRLPGIGRRTARRLVFHLLAADPEYCAALGHAIATLREQVRPCTVCGNVTEGDVCAICADPGRVDPLLCVVTSTADLLAIESAGGYRGKYHVLGGLLAPLDGVGPEALRIGELLRRLVGGSVEEVILATPPNVEGEATAVYLAELLRSKVAHITRIATGVPHGGELELFDAVTLSRALDGRRAIEP